MKVTLNIKERLYLIPVFPAEGKFDALVIKNDVVDKISIKQADVKKYKIREKDGRIDWDLKDGKDTETFDFTELEYMHIKLALQKADQDGKLNDSLLSVYKKFCLNK